MDKNSIAYETYRKLYLDVVDNSIRHFECRDKDIEPIQNIDPDDKTAVFEAYLTACLEIANQALSSGYWPTIDGFLQKYPFLKPYKARLL